MNIIIDRFEGEYAVVELPDGTIAVIPKKILPPDVKEGDVIKISVDKKETEKRKKKIQKLAEDLWE